MDADGWEAWHELLRVELRAPAFVELEQGTERRTLWSPDHSSVSSYKVR